MSPFVSEDGRLRLISGSLPRAWSRNGGDREQHCFGRSGVAVAGQYRGISLLRLGYAARRDQCTRVIFKRGRRHPTLRPCQGHDRESQGRSGCDREPTLSFDEILAKRTDALTKTLTGVFAKMNVNLDDAVRLQVDKFGNVTTEGPWKEKIEKFFQDHPELAKELKAVAGLNSLKAAQTALDLYNKEKGSTLGSKQQSEAWSRYNIRSMNIQTLSGVMTLKDGKLRSAAVDYMDMIADPTGSADPKRSRQDVADRLA
jgi:hypothetical protein